MIFIVHLTWFRTAMETYLWMCLWLFSERFNWEGKTHPDYVRQHTHGLGSWVESNGGSKLSMSPDLPDCRYSDSCPSSFCHASSSMVDYALKLWAKTHTFLCCFFPCILHSNENSTDLVHIFLIKFRAMKDKGRKDWHSIESDFFHHSTECSWWIAPNFLGNYLQHKILCVGIYWASCHSLPSLIWQSCVEAVFLPFLARTLPVCCDEDWGVLRSRRPQRSFMHIPFYCVPLL